MISNAACVDAMDLSIVGRSKFPISRTDLESCDNVIIIGKCYQIISHTSRIEEVVPFTPDCELTCQIPVMDTVSRCGDKCTG